MYAAAFLKHAAVVEWKLSFNQSQFKPLKMADHFKNGEPRLQPLLFECLCTYIL